MADKLQHLSLQSLYEELKNKSEIGHTHTFAGSIDSALSLRGIPAENFVRNDIKSQTIKSYGGETNLNISSNNTTVSLKANDNRAFLEVDSPELLTSNLTISGSQNNDVSVNINGQLLINEARVLTMNDKNELTGVDLSGLDIAGRGILIDKQEPITTEDGVIWGQLIEDDLVEDTTAYANNNLYTVPVGTIISMISSSVPNGYIKLDGRQLSRNVYLALWNFAKTQSVLVQDSEWKKNKENNETVLKFSYGDGMTSFRIPNIPSENGLTYMIKAYDELNVKETIGLNAIEEIVNNIKDNVAVSGVGYIKYPNGALIQYGTAIGTYCNFSISFIDNNYSIITNYEGSAVNVNNVSIINKEVNRCNFAVYNLVGDVLTTATIDYIAIGRWK